MTQFPTHGLFNRPEQRVLALFERIELPLLLSAAAIAGGTVILWLAPPLAAFAPAGWSKMTLPTALGVLLATVSLMISRHRRACQVAVLGRIVAAVLLTLGSLVLVVSLYFHFFNSGVPSWLSLISSPQTATTFILIGLSCLLVCKAPKPLRQWADIAVIALFAFNLFMLGGHVFQQESLVSATGGRLISPQTLFCFFLLALVLAGRIMAGDGILAELAGRGAGSRMSRMLLPFVVIAPFALFELITWLEESGLMPHDESRAILAPALALAMLAVIAWMGRRINDLEGRLQLQSTTDQLTNVFNRRGLDTVGRHLVHNAARHGTGLLVLFFDLDGLKQVNDTFGHDAGSEMLRRFADLLVDTFRKNDLVARVGGDEFIVVAEGDPLQVPQLLERLQQRVAASNADTHGASIAYSVGHAEVSPGANGLEAAIAYADQMMYLHKIGRRAAGIGTGPQVSPLRPARIA